MLFQLVLCASMSDGRTVVGFEDTPEVGREFPVGAPARVVRGSQAGRGAALRAPLGNQEALPFGPKIDAPGFGRREHGARSLERRSCGQRAELPDCRGAHGGPALSKLRAANYPRPARRRGTHTRLAGCPRSRRRCDRRQTKRTTPTETAPRSDWAAVGSGEKPGNDPRRQLATDLLEEAPLADTKILALERPEAAPSTKGAELLRTHIDRAWA